MRNPKTSKADLMAAFKSILLTRQSYLGSRGLEFVAAEMERIAQQALDGGWAGVATVTERVNKRLM